MKYRQIIAAIVCCCASIFTLSAQHETLRTEVIDGKEFYIYKVQPSEGFYVLSKKFGVSQEEIIRYNPAAKKGLKNGQILKIPTHKAEQKPVEETPISETFEHTIVRGESLYSISKTYKVSIQSIIDLNPGSEKGIRAGDKLRIPQGYQKKKSKKQEQKVAKKPTEKAVPPTKVVDPVTTTPPSADEGAANFIFHTIAKGETLTSISRQYGVDIETILKLNPGLSPQRIKAGEVIRLTPPASQQLSQATESEVDTKSQYTQYTVRKRETLYSISKKFGVTVDEIKALNPTIRKVKQGDVINIPTDAEYTPIATETSYSLAEIDNIYNQLYEGKKSGNIHVAVILPFMLKQPQPDKQACEFTEFYQGFLMAVDSLKRTGSSINVYAYDSEGEDLTVQSILAKNELKDMDLIIAPTQSEHFQMIAQFGQENEINVINTFSATNEEVNHNSRVFHTNIPPSFLQAETIHRFIRLLGDRTVVFLSQTGKKANRKNFVDELKLELTQENIPFQEIEFETQLDLIEKTSNFANDSRLVFVPNSDDADILSAIIAPIKQVKETRLDLDVALFGYPRWINFVPEYINDFYALNTYFYSRFYANPMDQATKDFHKRYWYWYNKHLISAYPSFALLGFDTGIYFLSAIQEQGKNFAFQDIKGSNDRIQTDFSFERINNWSGFINKSFYFINFTPDSSIRKIRD